MDMDIDMDVDMEMVDMDMDKQGLGPKGSSVDSILSFFNNLPKTKQKTWNSEGSKIIKIYEGSLSSSISNTHHRRTGEEGLLGN